MAAQGRLRSKRGVAKKPEAKKSVLPTAVVRPRILTEKLLQDSAFTNRATTGSYTYPVIDPSLMRSTASSMA